MIKIVARDSKFSHSLEFCNQGASQVLGCLQLADLLTGATASVINNKQVVDYKKEIIEYITAKNNNIPLDYSPGRFPGLYEYKINYFDPNDKPVVKV